MEINSSFTIGNNFEEVTLKEFKALLGLKPTNKLELRPTKDGKSIFLTHSNGTVLVAAVSRKLQDKLNKGDKVDAEKLVVGLIVPEEGDVDDNGKQRQPFYCVYETNPACANTKAFISL